MTSMVEQSVRTVARRSVWMVRCRGAAMFVALAGALVLAATLMDWAVRYQDLRLCWLVAVVVWSIIGVSFYRFVYRAWRYRCSDLHAAYRLEQQFPQLSEQLSSAVAFARQSHDDPYAGSADLRRAVVVAVQGAVGKIDVSKCFNRRAVLGPVVAAAVVVCSMAGIASVDVDAARFAAARLFTPWAAPAWPKRHDLRLVTTGMSVICGQAFCAAIVDSNGRLPDPVRVECWPDGVDETGVHVDEFSVQGDRFEYRRANVTAGFRIRAAGGDDQDMEWRRVDVVAGPNVKTLAFKLHPPAYSGLPQRSATGSFRTLDDTHVTLRGQTDKPLRRALLLTDTAPAAQQIRLQLTDHGRVFSLSLEDASVNTWQVVKTGTYSIQAWDTHGRDSGTVAHGDVQAIVDKPPVVTIGTPRADMEVTRNARLPITVDVADDLAVHAIRWQYRIVGQAAAREPVSRQIWRGPDRPPLSNGAAGDGTPVAQQTANLQFEVADVAPRETGSVIECWALATDYKGQIGKSDVRRLTLIANDAFLAHVASRQAQILERIAALVTLQADTHTRTESLRIQAVDVGQMMRGDIDQLESVELSQRQIRQALVGADDSVHRRIGQLIDLLDSNQLAQQETWRRLHHMDDVIARLDRSVLASAQNDLGDALSIVGDAESAGAHGNTDVSGTQFAELLTRVGQNQDVAVDELQRLLREFSHWDSYQQLVRQLAQIRDQQEGLRTTSQQLRAATVGKSLDDLALQQRADVDRTAGQQRDLSQQFARWIDRATQTGSQLRDSDAALADTLERAIDAATDAGLTGLMFNAGERLRTNQLGQAINQQRDAIAGLAKLHEMLVNMEPRTAAEQIGLLTRLNADIQTLEKDHSRAVAPLSQTTELPAANRKQLSQQELAFAQRIAELRQIAKQLGTTQLEQALRDAEQALRQAGAAARNHDDAQLRRQVGEASKALARAAQEAAKAADELQRNAQQRQQQLLRQAVQAMAAEQRRVLAQTRRLDQDRPRAAALAGERQQRLGTLTAQQQRLTSDMDQLRVATGEFVAIDFVLAQVQQTMAAAHQRLVQSDTGSQTQQAQQDAVTLLSQVAESLAPVTPTQQQNGETNDPANDAGQSNGDDPLLLAQLTLIRGLQLQINQQTAQLCARLKAAPWDDIAKRRHEQLVDRQRSLAQLVQRLLTLEPAAGGERNAPRRQKQP